MFERYTEQARKAVFFARYEASQCGSTQIETEHLLLGILREDTQLAQRLSLSPAKVEKIRAQICKPFEGRSSTSTSVDLPLSPLCKRALKYGAEEADRLKQRNIAPEHLLLGILREESAPVAAILRDFGFSFDRVRDEAIRRAAERIAPKPVESLPTTGPFRDLIQAAASDESGPLVGREREVERIIRILSRRTKNNVFLIGEAGVGKTAIVEGLAQRMAQARVPSFLEDRRLVALDTSSLLIPAQRTK
jgi:ATP-dependent Clp protease ATP-binding subunit ClpC